jgi:ferritin-like protein
VEQPLPPRPGEPVLAGALLGMGAALLAACSRGGQSVTSTGAPQALPGASAARDAEAFVSAIDLENRLIYAYSTAIDVGRLSPGARQLSMEFRDHHRAHADALTSALEGAGGRAPDRRPRYDLTGKDGRAPDLLSDGGLLSFAAFFENVAAEAYLVAAGAVSTTELTQAMASIMAIEARHSAVLREAGKREAIPAPFIGKQS